MVSAEVVSSSVAPRLDVLAMIAKENHGKYWIERELVLPDDGQKS